MNHQPFPPSRREAFTLIEILVVIVIIGVLAGMLLPMYNRITESGRATQCLSQMHQISAGWVSYTADHNNTLPGPCWAGQGAYTRYYYDSASDPTDPNGSLAAFLAPYMGITLTTISTFQPVFMCPTYQITSSSGKGGTDLILNNGITGKSGEWQEPFGYPNTNPPNPGATPLRLSSLDFDLTKTWALTELDRNWYTNTSSGWYTQLPPGNQPLHISYRNAIFFDGHAGRVTGPNNTPL